MRLKGAFRLVGACLVSTGAALTVACGSATPSSSSSPLDATQMIGSAATSGLDHFQTAVARDVRRNFQVYWLGRTFSARGSGFHGPSFPLIAAENNSDEFDLEYPPDIRLGSC